MKKLLISLITLLIVTGCASSGRKAQKKLKSLTSKGDIASAIKLVKGKSFFPEERSRLLKLLELGTLYHLNGDFYQSLKTFDKAKELSDKLFTVSISKGVTAAISNDNMDNYYGEKYERSLIRFYLALNHFLISEIGEYEAHTLEEKVKNNKGKEVVKKTNIPLKKLSAKERRQHLFGARASIVEWDTLLENYKSVMKGQTSYKVDLTAKIFGAYIHERIGTRDDLNIAKGLYKNAKQVLFRYYNLYPAYNEKYKNFEKDYSKLPKMSEAKVKAGYVKETKYAKRLLSFIESRLKDLKGGNKDNVKVIIQDGHVAEKKARQIDFPLPTAKLGTGGIIGFATSALGAAAGTIPTISFELPEVRKKNLVKDYKIVIKDKTGKVVAESPLTLINPISQIAYFTLDEKISSVYAKIGARVALKHVTALVAAYAIAQKTGEYAGYLSYAIANKGIRESEKADLRFWSTLPNSIRMASLKVPEGEYDVFIGGMKTQLIKKGSVKVDKKKISTLSLNIY